MSDCCSGKACQLDALRRRQTSTLKIVLLMLIWWFVFAPQPKPDVSPAAIADRLAPAQSHVPPETQP